MHSAFTFYKFLCFSLAHVSSKKCFALVLLISSRLKTLITYLLTLPSRILWLYFFLLAGTAASLFGKNICSIKVAKWEAILQHTIMSEFKQPNKMRENPIHRFGIRCLDLSQTLSVSDFQKKFRRKCPIQQNAPQTWNTLFLIIAELARERTSISI